MTRKLTIEEFLNRVWNINPSYRERFCYYQCDYTGMINPIKVRCKKHNHLFEILPHNHENCAKREIRENILLSGGCTKCISHIRKTNLYRNNETCLPENYNKNDWKTVKDFEDYYINNRGDIWSKLTNKYINPNVNDSGYLVATLYKNNNVRTKSQKRVHILVAERFVNNPKPELYKIVNHLDGNRRNPLHTNLQWTDRSGNSKHAHQNPENYKEQKPATIHEVETDDEYWKEMIPEFQGYFISNFGNVKNKSGKQLCKNNSSESHDHLSVSLIDKNGKYFRKQVHKLVIEHHLKVKYNTSNMIVDHKDNNKHNNYIGNLEWVTHHINTQRSAIDGCWNRKNRQSSVSHISYRKWSTPNKKTKIQKFKYHVCMHISGVSANRFVDTKEEAIQQKKELYAIMIISNYIKYKKGLQPKYFKLNINFKHIDNEITLL